MFEGMNVILCFHCFYASVISVVFVFASRASSNSFEFQKKEYTGVTPTRRKSSLPVWMGPIGGHCTSVCPMKIHSAWHSRAPSFIGPIGELGEFPESLKMETKLGVCTKITSVVQTTSSFSTRRHRKVGHRFDITIK